MRPLFGCPDIVSLTEKFLMARIFFQIFTENNPARGTGKKYNMPDVNWFTILRKILVDVVCQIVQADVVTAGLDQSRRSSEVSSAVVATTEVTPEITMTTGQTDVAGGPISATDSSGISSAMEVWI